MPSHVRTSLNKWDDAAWFQATALSIAAALLAFGMILAIAANWDTIGRPGQFALVGGALLAGCAASLIRQSLRTPGLIVAFAATGGLFALIGQIFQTGADPWQLFAAWAIATLPFAIASRSDALWMPWSLVAMTGVQLWLHQTSGRSFTAATSSTSVYVSWILSAALILALLPGTTGRSELGTSRWSFRFAVALGFIAITGTALTGLFGLSPARYLLGLLACGGIAFLIASVRPVDLLALTIAALAIDTLLIGGMIRAITSGHNSGLGTWLLIGILSMAIVAGSVKAILAIAEDDPTVSALNAKLGTTASDGRHWPLAVLSTLGAIFATIPLIVVLGIAFGKVLFEGPGTYIGAAIILGAAGTALRTIATGTFMRQFCVTILTIGIALLAFALYRDMPLRAASLLLSAAAVGLAFAFNNRWISTVLGALAAALVLFAAGGSVASLVSPLGWSIIIVLWAIGISGLLSPRPSAASEQGDPIPALATGAIIAALLSLSLLSGPSFMLGGYMGWTHHQIAVPNGFVFQATFMTAVSVTMALAAAALTISNIPAMKSPAGIALALAALVLSYLTPTLGPVLVIGAVALITGRNRLALASVAAILWIVGETYYALSMPLWMKGATLFGAGLLVGAATLLSGVHLPALPPAADPQPPAARTFATPMTLAGLAIIAALAGTSVWKYSSIINSGQRALLALAPVDPRSLMQGDYMTLRFALANDARLDLNKAGLPEQTIIAKLDANNIATFDRLATQGPALGPGEVLIALTKKSGTWIVGTDAYHFKEGDSQKFQSAAYGDFRFAPNGHPILTGLISKDLKPLN
ncbi:MAG: GDYXXLXY domain-containing protein [Hyphomicrobiaceae bacterium]